MDPHDPPPADTIEKRRKQIEKAKAAHLSRQLQTRLQYARLKVDHGWQKQTLNEVENLYFHHYRARMTSDVQRSQSHPPVPESAAIASTSSHSTPVAKTPSPSKSSQPPLNPSPGPYVQHRAAHSPVSHSLSSNPLVNVSPSLSRNLPLTKHPSLPQSAVPRLRGPTPAIRLSHSTPPPSMPGSSNIALTYDSFWSSHSTTSTNYRSTMTSTASFNKGDTGSELPNLETSYAFSMGASNPSFEPLPLQEQRSLSRKPAVTALRQTYSRSMGDG